jgi:hypothetical protein
MILFVHSSVNSTELEVHFERPYDRDNDFLKWETILPYLAIENKSVSFEVISKSVN